MDWGQLARVQDQIAKAEDLKRREREIQHKILYKNELEKMIQEKNNYRKSIQEEEKKSTESNFLTLNIINTESPPRMRFENMLKESAQYNFSLGKQKKIRLRSYLQEQKSVLREKYKKTQTEISQERQKKLQEKQKKKRELALCYEAQISNQDSKKYLQKLQNQKFEQLAHQLEIKKSQQREQHINKIKFGYIQNPQSYQRVKQLYNSKQEEKLNFIKRMESSSQKDELLKERHTKDLKHMQTIQTGRFNKNHFLEKQFRMRQLQQQELQAQKLKMIQLRNQLTQEEERAKTKKSLERQSLKTQLESQISSERQNRLKWKRMSQNQSRINKPFFDNQLSMFPGLSKDHKDIKKQLILDSFLSGIRPLRKSQRGIK